MIGTLFFLTAECQCDGRTQKLAQLFSPERFQAEQLKGLKHADDQQLGHLVALHHFSFSQQMFTSFAAGSQIYWNMPREGNISG